MLYRTNLSSIIQLSCFTVIDAIWDEIMKLHNKIAL